MGYKISIVIPVYNEEKRIGKTLEEYVKFFRQKKKSKEIKSFEIITVLNGCKDNTLWVVKSYKKKYREIKILDFKKAAKGFAVTEGFKYALKNNDNLLIGFVDADMSTSSAAYFDLIDKIKDYDGIIASRYIKNSIVRPKQTFIRRLASRVFNFLIRTLFFLNYRDTQCGAKLFKRKATKIIVGNIGITEWAFDIDMLYIAKKNNLKIRELPTIWEDKAGSKLNIKKTSIRMFFSIIRLRINYSMFRGFIRLYESMPEFFKLHHKLRQRN